MGNHPTHHQPLERGARGNGLRFSKRGGEKSPGRRMDRLRRSFRDSFRRRKEPHTSEASKPHLWLSDENAVRSATCAFQVKYLGCVEVYESRGMQVCEEALKVLRNSKRRPVRATLHVSGDGLRVVEDETKGLIVDQTIEKVSFCAPDRNHDKGFSYICRDGTTRRWMCHGFLALKESGERLSHAVGCAFAACLERKQMRDKECKVTMTFDQKTSTFTRSGSFRLPSLTDRLQDSKERAIDVPLTRQVYNPFAIERPHATPSMLERQGSFRGFNQLNQASPFKRQLSLRVNDLPSNFERARSHSLELTDLSRLPPTSSHQISKAPVSPIPEILLDGHDSVSAMCQQLSQGLSLLSNNDDYVPTTTITTAAKKLCISLTTTAPDTFSGEMNSNSLDDLTLQNGQCFGELNTTTVTNNNTSLNRNSSANSTTSSMSNNNNLIDENASEVLNRGSSTWENSSSNAVSSVNNKHRLTPILNKCSLSPVLQHSSVTSTSTNAIGSIFYSPAASPAFSNASTSSLGSLSHQQTFLNMIQKPSLPTLSDSPSVSSISKAGFTALDPNAVTDVATNLVDNTTTSSVPLETIPLTTVQAVQCTKTLPNADQWLGSVTTQAAAVAAAPSDNSKSLTNLPLVPPAITPRRAPPLHARTVSLGSAQTQPTSSRLGPSDPFDAEWAEIAAHNLRQASSTNPFIMPNATQAFQVQM